MTRLLQLLFYIGGGYLLFVSPLSLVYNNTALAGHTQHYLAGSNILQIKPAEVQLWQAHV